MKETNLKILFDSNVIIDAVSQREETNEDSKYLFLAAIEGKIEGYLVSKQITDMYYVLRKYVDKVRRDSFIDFLLEYFHVLPLTASDLSYGLELELKDYEDAVLCGVGLKNKLDYIVTNNIKDFNTDLVNAVLPKAIVNKL
jgi:predicted nucleic acid-binding protein